MFNIAGSFVFSVVSLYSLYRAWSWPDANDSSVEMSSIHTIWSIYYNVNIVGLLWAGSTMRNEVKLLFEAQQQKCKKQQKIL